MKQNPLIFIGLISIILLAGCQETILKTPPSAISETMEKIVESKEAMMFSKTQDATSTTMTKNPQYSTYTREKYNELKGKKPLVLFFHAPWCPLCRAQDKEITANLASFPAQTNIIKTDYDTETALKQEYGITVQTTFVVLNSAGKTMAILLDPSLEDLKSAISKSI